ncbi:LPS export ABC transporter permease LptF [Bartonella henselae]|uniref:Putative permease, YjgP/YjgQ family n=1 Tax=Bartonella henselae TaxID=38323 RepID=X5M3W5_BARHN|nr:LPS export ABC transporter permease LptF [Bartonella henselae]MDM9996321.1 LPS export ABC transporter permease LptF [Bartonella henselae]OLL48401.1 LPS export ABC transporter permease LptF [Bartonella henselae]OLL48729.1 LPS export ABC transporter permease LptF [Bartonella henselae]OLL49823.1 LPS export ABC transporter permease LptF [Bartonella henselae]OLL57376.1 LPS export ABC transporter permease LptF [Bartonella henselae]
MRIIELYILKRILILFSAVMIAAIGISWTVQILARINFLTTSKQTLLTILQFSISLVPSVIFLVIPFALLIAITSTLSAMNQDSELAIISASGFPKSTVWRPILLIAFVASCASFFIANFVIPQARLNMRQMLATTHYDLINLFISEGSFQKLANNLYIEIGQRNPDGTLAHLFIADQRDPKIDLFYYATKASVVSNKNGHFLVLNNGEIERINHQNDSVSIVQFSSYTFSLGEFIPNDKTPTLYPKDRPLSYLRNPNPKDLYYQRKPLQYRAEFHRRLTEWLYPIVFSLIALAAAGDTRSYRQVGNSANFSAIAFSFLVYWMGYFAAEKAKSDLAYVPLLYIIPIGVSILVFFMLLTNRTIGTPTKLNEVIQIVFQKVISKFEYRKSQSPPDEVS